MSSWRLNAGPEWLSSKPLPAECVPLVFATHACSFATAIDEGAILVGTAYEAKRQARIEASFTARLRPVMSFVDSAYTAATVQRLVERRLGKPGGGRPTDPRGGFAGAAHAGCLPDPQVPQVGSHGPSPPR